MANNIDSRIQALAIATLLMLGSRLNAQGFVIEHGPALAQDGVGVVALANGFLVGMRSYQQSPSAHAAEIWAAGTTGNDMGTTMLNDPPGQVFLHGMIASSDGSVFLHGSTIPLEGHSHDGFVIKRDPDGTTVWTTVIALEGDQHYLGACAMPDGGIVVCGTTNATGDHDALIARFDTEGTMMWSISDGFELDEEAYAVAVQGSDIMATGRQLNFGGTSDAWFGRLSTAGDLIWTTSWGGIANDVGRGIVAVAPGSFVMAGTTNSYGTFDLTEQRIKDHIYLVALDLNGDSLWTRAVGDTLYDRRAFDVATASNGDLLLAAERSAVIGESDCHGMRTGPDGTLQWERSWDLGKEERLLDIVALPDGLVATGWVFNESSRQVVLIRKDPDGN